MADQFLNTSDLTVHELCQAFMARSADRLEQVKLVVTTVLTFGFKQGIAVESDLVFDVRLVRNRHFVPRLRHLTGRDREVLSYLTKAPATREFLGRVTDMLRSVMPRYVSEGERDLTIGIGCTGGRHRSVAIGEALRERLRRMRGVRLRVRRRDNLAE